MPSIELTDLETAHSTTPSSLNAGLSWHPKVTPHRLLSLLLPASLGTAKAIASQQGRVNEPITLEWISAVVVFIVLFTTATYEYEPIEHIPAHLAWFFKYDCMDAVWWLLSKLSRGFSRPSYISEEVNAQENRGTMYIVTSYRLLVCATVVTLGLAKAGLTYGNVSVGATWFEWMLGVLISSILYVIGLYESNTTGLYSSFFGTNRADVLRNGYFKFVMLFFLFNSLWAMFQAAFFIFRPSSAYSDPNGILATPEQIEQIPIVQRVFNQVMHILLDGVVVALFLFSVGLFFTWLTLTFIGICGINIQPRLPLRIQVLFARMLSLYLSYINATLGPPPALTATLRATLGLGGRIISAILAFTLCAFAAFFAPSFTSGSIYRVARGDIILIGDANGEPLHAAQYAVLYAMFTFLALLFIFSAVLFLVWSTRNMGRYIGRVWVDRWKPALRKLAQSVLKRMGKWKRRVKSQASEWAIRILTRLTGLDRSEEVHYSFLEFLSTLHTGNHAPSH